MAKPLGVRALLNRDGCAIVPGFFDQGEIRRMISLLPDLGDSGGTRTLLALDWVKELTALSRVQDLVSKANGRPGLSATRAILFDKSPSANWVLGWHQDQIMALPHQVPLRGFSRWTEKEGIWHCRPPKRFQELALAMRIHLDDCGPENGPLRVLPGTHKDGYRAKPTATELTKEKALPCSAGDVILMKPLLFHASSKALTPTHRRVIHIEFSPLLEITMAAITAIVKSK